MTHFNLDHVHPSWLSCLNTALKKVDPNYLEKLAQSQNWLPGKQNIFNAFSIALADVHYILLGESPYPRPQSANGYAFWDGAVKELWSDNGLSKTVNRATSLRNIIKMLFIAEGLLSKEHSTQIAIAKIDKSHLVQTNQQLFENFLQQGFLLLNASLVLQDTPVKQDAKRWQPFITHVLECLLQQNPNVELLLWGNIAKVIQTPPHSKKLIAEHPYNISFITNSNIIDFFRPLHLLKRRKSYESTPTSSTA